MMSNKIDVVILKSAQQDLQDLKSYVAKSFGKDSWQASYTKIKQAVSTIQQYPLNGKIPDELESLHMSQYRQVLSGMNRIVYEVTPKTIYIHVVCDTRKDLRALLMQRILREN